MMSPATAQNLARFIFSRLVVEANVSLSRISNTPTIFNKPVVMAWTVASTRELAVLSSTMSRDVLPSPVKGGG